MTEEELTPHERASLHASFIEGIYSADPNPIYLWMIFAIYRENGVNPPDYVMDYLHRISINIYDLALEYNKSKAQFGNIGSRLSEAMEMKKPGRSGRGSVFERFRKLHNYWISFSLSKEIEKGTKTYIAVETVAKKYGVSEATVWRALPGSIKMLEVARANPPPKGGPIIPF